MRFTPEPGASTFEETNALNCDFPWYSNTIARHGGHDVRRVVAPANRRARNRGESTMEFPVKTGAAASQRTECAILPVFEDGQLRGATREIDTAARGIIKQLVRKGDVAGRPGSTTLINRTQGTAATRWLLVGCGKHA